MASDAIKKLLPSSDIGRLKRLSAKEIALAFLQSQKAAMADKATAIKCLSDVCDAEAAIASAIEAKWLREEAGLLASAPDASGYPVSYRRLTCSASPCAHFQSTTY